MKWSWSAVLVLCLGCHAAVDAEREGDRAYVGGAYASAYGQYVALARHQGAPRQWAKAAGAASRAGMFDSATSAYLRLASVDSTRRQEAADGLQEVARRAADASSGPSLRRAIVALHALAPTWPVGRYALSMLRDSMHPTVADIVELTPPALASADDPDTQDRLLLQYAAAMVQRSSCDEAARAYGGVMRRARDPAFRDSAAAGFANCALQLGRAASSGMLADRWLARAANAQPGSLVSRRALLALGEARLSQGDPIAAAIAWQQAAGNESDSVAVAARAHLAMLQPAEPEPVPDSTHTAPGIPDPADGI